MEHRCRRGSYCPEFEQLDDGTRVGAAINATEGLCGACERHVERGLAELPRDYVVLNTLIGKGSTAGGEPVAMTKELPVPIKVHVEALQRDMVSEAAAWATSVAEVLNVRFAVHGGVRPGWLLGRSCALLAGASSAFLALRDCKHIRWEYGHRVVVARDGLDGALNILRLHQKARAYTGQTRFVTRLPVPCPRCESMSLEREDGTDTIDCTDCLRRYTFDEYEKLCLILVGRSEAGVA